MRPLSTNMHSTNSALSFLSVSNISSISSLHTNIDGEQVSHLDSLFLVFVVAREDRRPLEHDLPPGRGAGGVIVHLWNGFQPHVSAGQWWPYCSSHVLHAHMHSWPQPINLSTTCW